MPRAVRALTAHIWYRHIARSRARNCWETQTSKRPCVVYTTAVVNEGGQLTLRIPGPRSVNCLGRCLLLVSGKRNDTLQVDLRSDCSFAANNVLCIVMHGDSSRVACVETADGTNAS